MSRISDEKEKKKTSKLVKITLGITIGLAISVCSILYFCPKKAEQIGWVGYNKPNQAKVMKKERCFSDSSNYSIETTRGTKLPGKMSEDEEEICVKGECFKITYE